MQVDNIENSLPATPSTKSEFKTPSTGARKRSAISRKLQALIDSGQLVIGQPVLGSPSTDPGEDNLLDDGSGNPTSCIGDNGSRKRKNNDIDDWFQSKLAIRSTSSSQSTMPPSTPKGFKYHEIKKMLEERLAIQRREDMERRHGFYNADNEIFSTKDEEEEEDEEEEAELTDEEEEGQQEREEQGQQPEQEEVQDSKASILKAHIKTKKIKQQIVEEDEQERQPATESCDSETEEFHPSSDSEQSIGTETGHFRRHIKKQCDSPTKEPELPSKPIKRAPKVIESDEGAQEQEYDENGSGRSTPAIRSMNGVPYSSQGDDLSSCGSFARVPSWKAPRRAKQEPELGFANENMDMFPADELNVPLRPAAEDFKEALFLCSGTFDSSEAPYRSASSEPPMSSLALTQSDLFTAEEDEEDEFLPPAPPPQSKMHRIKTEILESYAENSSSSMSQQPFHRRHIKGEQEDEEEEEEVDVESVVENRRVKIADMFEDEASLSGDDVGSDAEEGGSELDEYEAEEGDMDELPDNEEIRDNLVKQYIKQKNDEEERRILKLQEHFFSDSDLHGHKDMDRSFRFRMRNDMDVDWKKLLGNLENEADAEIVIDDDEEESVEMTQFMERKVEMNKWRLEQKKEKKNFAGNSSIQEGFATSHTSLIKIGQRIVMKQQKVTESTIIVSEQTPGPSTLYSTSDSQLLPPPSPFSSLRKGDSLLRNSRLLGSLLKEGPTGGTPTTRTVFATPKTEVRSRRS